MFWEHCQRKHNAKLRHVKEIPVEIGIDLFDSLVRVLSFCFVFGLFL